MYRKRETLERERESEDKEARYFERDIEREIDQSC